MPTIAIVGAINCGDVAIVTGNSAAPVLAKDTGEILHIPLALAAGCAICIEVCP